MDINDLLYGKNDIPNKCIDWIINTYYWGYPLITFIKISERKLVIYKLFLMFVYFKVVFTLRMLPEEEIKQQVDYNDYYYLLHCSRKNSK